MSAGSTPPAARGNESSTKTKTLARQMWQLFTVTCKLILSSRALPFSESDASRQTLLEAEALSAHSRYPSPLSCAEQWSNSAH